MPKKYRRKSSRGITSVAPAYMPSIPHTEGNQLDPIVKDNWIWCPLKSEWRVLFPEEYVRQKYILVLYSRYGYSFQQMDQERRTKHGRKSPKADIAIWESIVAKNEGRAPIIVVECKSDNVTIDPDDYEQGDSYARAIGSPCEFLVMHNSKETRYFRIVRGLPGTRDDIENIPACSDLDDASKMEAIRRATKAFSREEFRRLLFDCHCILRDNHKMEPGKAFDEISKILFIKMYIERTGNYDKFTTSYLDEYARMRRRNLEEVMHDLFDDTKMHYQADRLFGPDDRLSISFATFKRIVKLLERFNLGATGDDVKGIAFERFLGQTFRGELGQFFTPRVIVDFMIEFLDPSERDIMCDPASGSGGFLIKHFEYIRSKIESEVHGIKRSLRTKIESKNLNEDDEAVEINSAFSKLNEELDVSRENSRLWNIAHKGIFGCDAEPRAARTSKMNMIMHGDGHGGIHHHDGLVDINGIFPGRFDLIITNPPFGAKVEDDQIVGDTPETRVETSPEVCERNESLYGELYRLSHERMLQAGHNRETILSLYDIAGSSKSQKTEVLFLERCLKLVKPGGRIGIVVPDGVLNNPSMIYLREYIEDRAHIMAVISIPDKTFRSAKTNVKASLLFLQRLSVDEEVLRNRTREEAERTEAERIRPEVDLLSRALRVTWEQYERTVKSSVVPPRAANLASAFEVYGTELEEDAFNESRGKLRTHYRSLIEIPRTHGRRTAKMIYDYDIFMGVVEHVGIRASGKIDPINDLPHALDVWRNYINDKSCVARDVTQPIFKINWSEIDRWDPSAFKPIEWHCEKGLLKPLGSALKMRVEPVNRNEFDFSELTPITIHFDGSMDPRDTSDSDEYTMDLYFAKPGDIVVSKIDLKNGAVGIVPPEFENVVVTNHFNVYEPILDIVHPPYLMRMIQSKFFKDFLWRKKVGSEGRKEVKIDIFESTLIPLPKTDIQKSIVENWEKLKIQHQEILSLMKKEQIALDHLLITGGERFSKP